MESARLIKVALFLIAFAGLSYRLFRLWRSKRERRLEVSDDFTPSQQFRIAIIDDDIEFRFPADSRKALLARGFNVDYFEDINNIRQLAGYRIIVCDIQGVGRSLGINNSGHGGIIVSELRKYRPLTYIITISNMTFDINFNHYFYLADKRASAAVLSTEAIVDFLEEAVRVLQSPEEQWRRFKKYILGNRAEELKPVKLRKIRKRFLKLTTSGREQVMEHRLGQLNLPLNDSENDSSVAEFAISTSELADRLLELLH
jgi:hypothetical protein